MFWSTGLKTSKARKFLQNSLKIFVKSSKFKSDLTVEVQAYKCHQLEESPDTNVTVTKQDAITYYTQMFAIRQIENVSAALYREKSIRGFCHLYSGQEAIAVGIKAAMRKADSVITSYRAHGWTWLMGVSILGVIAELTGRESGCARGKGGSMHMYGTKFYGGNGIVGAQVPLGTGIAFASKYRGDGGVCISLYGDGAANQGQLAEAFNIAGLWSLPAIYVCENNRYGMGTATHRSSYNNNYYTRGDLLPGLWVDGMDVLAVRNAAVFAIEYATKFGPIVLEAYTYRYSGHSMSDPGISYRSREEIQEVRDKHDPIASFKKKCLDGGLIKEDEFAKIEEQSKKEVNDAAAKAKTDKEIALEELTFDVYANCIAASVRGAAGQPFKHQLKGKPVNV